MDLEIPPEIKTILWTAGALVVFLLLTSIFPGIGRDATASKLEKGKEIDAAITLITADAVDLACAAEGPVAGSRCGYDSDGRPVPADLPVLAPYMTVDNVLFLVPDLWKEPALARRLAEDPPRERERSKRFTARCRMKLVEKASNFSVRWARDADWGFQKDAWVGTISRCKIEG